MKDTLVLALTALMTLPSVAQEPPAPPVQIPTQAEADLARAKVDTAKAEGKLAQAQVAQARAEMVLAVVKGSQADSGVPGLRPVLRNSAALGGFCGQAQVEAWMMNTTVGQELRRRQQAELERMMQRSDVIRKGTAPDLEKVAAAAKKPGQD